MLTSIAFWVLFLTVVKVESVTDANLVEFPISTSLGDEEVQMEDDNNDVVNVGLTESLSSIFIVLLTVIHIESTTHCHSH